MHKAVSHKQKVSFELLEIPRVSRRQIKLDTPIVDGEFGWIIYKFSTLDSSEAWAFFQWRYDRLFTILDMHLIEELPNGDRLYRLHITQWHK